MRLTRIIFPAALVALSALGAGLACTAPGDESPGKAQTAQNQDPPGNNGTVKIQEFGATDEIPDNDPQVGCKFQIEFRGYDEGDLQATWRIDAQPPTGTRTIASGSVDIGGDPAGGANDVDAVEVIDLATYDLSGLEQNPIKGYHIKLEVQAEGSQGADTKFKVFWAKCEVPDGGPPPPTDGGPPPPPTDGGPPPPPTDGGPPPPPTDGGPPPPPTDGGPPPPPTDGGPPPPPPPTDGGKPTW